MSNFDLVHAALVEDIGLGDITTTYFIDAKSIGKARIIAKEFTILSGQKPVQTILSQFNLEANWFYSDGTKIKNGETILELKGSLKNLLVTERTLLNFLQHLSGIATSTYHYVEMVAGTKAKILDTRKTLPGWRHLAKEAVRHGGGTNHRMGLYDQVMIKDNHLAALKNNQAKLNNSLEKIRREKPEIKIEIEADTLEQVSQFASLPIDLILLDNMSPTELSQAIQIIAGRCKTEASGGITLQTVRTIAETGVDFISIGALTHSVKAIDFSMEIES